MDDVKLNDDEVPLLPPVMVYESHGKIMTEKVIREGIIRDEERGTYTFFDYMERAMRIPYELLVEFTNLDQDTRRDRARYMDFPPARSHRIWKKATFE